MKQNKRMLIFLTILLAGCGNNTTSVPTPSTTTSSSTSIGFQDNVPSDFIDQLNGTYYGKTGSVVIADESVTFNDIEFSLTKRVVESFKENGKDVDHAVTYLKAEDGEYRIYLSGEGKYVLNLDKKENDQFVLVDTFMPSIDEFSGAYSAFGDGDEYNTIVHLGGNFNYYYGSFDVGFYGMFAGFHLDTYYAESYYIYFDNELTKVVSMFDYVDNYEYYSFMIRESNGVVGLINPDYYTGTEDDWYDFYYDPLCLSYNYFSNEDSISYPTLDVANKKVTINDIEYTYQMARDEQKGQCFTLTNAGKEVKVYPNQYGMNWVANDKTKQYVYDSTDLIFGSYSYEDIDFEYKYDDNFEPAVFINGTKVAHSYEIYNNAKAIKVSYENKEYCFAPFKTDVALLSATPDGDVFFINKAEFTSIYGKSFIHKGVGSYKEMVITEEFDVIYDGKISEANLYYDPLVKYPYLQFNINGKEYQYTLLQENIGAAVLTSEDTTEYFFDKEMIAVYYGDYTFHHEIDLTMSEFKLEYYGEKVDYTIEPYYYADSFTYLLAIKFKADNQEIIAFLGNEMMAMDVKEGNKTVTKTCIKYKYFGELVGEYYFDGVYGPEKFKLTKDGHFYADTLNATKDGLVYDVEYNYSLQMTMDVTAGNSLPSVIFHVNNTLGIQLVKVGHTMVVGGTVYTAKYLFDFRGVYVDANTSTVMEVREDSVYINGEEQDIASISYDEYGTYITLDSDITFTFMKYDEEYYVSSDENSYTEYTKSTFDFDSLLGTYTFDSTTYTLAKGVIPMTDVEYGYSMSDGFMSTTDYSVVMRNGNLALMFKLLSDTIYVYNDGTTNVIEVVKPSLPPVPPPPPPPPLI